MKSNKKNKYDYVLRYGNIDTIYRTNYDTLSNIKKCFKKIKTNNKYIWGEIIFEPLEKEDVQIIIDSFEKQTINIMGIDIVLNKNETRGK